ncbi:CHRD domain-containing protein [Aliiglaciecola litoralis]|uniref:CHRD domain-containing protein n=1 Tax=Aliiglaciecola litoralis TaxID=582857 RepID=A0ABP3WP64_9ALTE
MKTKTLVQSVLIICFTAVSHFASAGMIFMADLSGDQEVPAVSTSASGMAMAELTGTVGAYILTYQIDYMDLNAPIIDAAGGGHFHNAPPGVNGGVVHLFDTDLFEFLGTTSGTIMGDWRFDDTNNPLTDLLADELMAGNIYINFHTQFSPSGEIRGQMTRVSEPSVLMLMGLVLLLISRGRFIR